MSGRAFIDTNVFAYALDRADPSKRARAQQVIAERGDHILVSTQVLIELYAVCTRKLSMSSASTQRAVGAVARFPVVDTDRALVLSAVALSESAHLSIFDAAIIAAAQRAGAETLLTEDLSAGQRFGELVVVNPFTS